MKRVLIAITILVLLSSCEGLLRVSGTVYSDEAGTKIPIASSVVKVYCGQDWLRGTVTTDSTGQYYIDGLTTPQRATYYIIFESEGYKTDTVKVAGKRGKTIVLLDHIMTIENDLYQ